MSGKLFVIEGLDGSGKQTQTELLTKRLCDENIDVRHVEYPNYKSDSSALVKMYLRGDFGTNPDDVDAYVSSTFYAVDRYASYKTEYESFYKGGGIVLADRYTTSNMVHQASKIKDEKEKEKYLAWLWDYEFNLYKIPIPEKVFFLDVKPEVSKALTENRPNKITGESKKDIHERNYEYLISSYENALMLCEKYSWERIDCTEGGKLRSIEDINDELYERMKKYL